MGGASSTIMPCSGVSSADGHQLTMYAPSCAELEAYSKEVKASVKDQIEQPIERFERYMASFRPDVAALSKTVAAFVDECATGLECHKKHPMEYRAEECSFKHLDSFVPCAPSGKENGVFYALDFGGSNFRVLRVDMADGQTRITAQKASLLDCDVELPKRLLDPKATATEMFDFFADVCSSFMEANGDIKSGKPFPLGFTFSYPCTMRALDSAALMVWTKGFETGRDTDDQVEGNDVAELMNMAFARKQLPLVVNCVANDTVGTMLSCAYTLDTKLYPPCAVGLILGTGMNACYVEDRANEWGYKGKIINIECGNFNRALPRTNIDYELDFADAGGRGRQHLEKMVSGAYVGEICRRMVVKILQDKSTPSMWIAGSFSSEDAAVCVTDKSANLVVVARKCAEKWNASFTLQELGWIHAVCQVVYERAAALTAVIIAGCGLKTGRLREAVGGITVGIDGSLWKCNPFLQQDVRKYLDLLLGAKQSSLIHLADSEDGSGLGAAILSAVAAQV